MSVDKLRASKLGERMAEKVLIPGGVSDPRVLDAMKRIPRERFVEEALQHQAYGDFALPIGFGQTLSQPLTVGMMSQGLRLTGTEKVLEIGAGSGYQTAVLALLCKKVFSIERILSLLEPARRRLHELGLGNAYVRAGDGTIGWGEEAPFDAVIVTAGSPSVPPALLEQLKEGGRLVIPIGDEVDQELMLWEKTPTGLMSSSLGKAKFVKLVGHHGWKNQ